VFRHRTNPDREYVQDRNGFFIARYLIRNLSEYDREHLKDDRDRPLKARVDRVPDDQTLIADSTRHVRAKEESGDTCFVSFTHTSTRSSGPRERSSTGGETAT
jgi:hypothetical protein